jgi:hypothetical protein
MPLPPPATAPARAHAWRRRDAPAELRTRTAVREREGRTGWRPVVRRRRRARVSHTAAGCAAAPNAGTTAGARARRTSNPAGVARRGEERRLYAEGAARE